MKSSRSSAGRTAQPSPSKAKNAKCSGRSSYVQSPDWIAALDRCFNVLNLNRWIDAHTVRSRNRWSHSHGSDKARTNLPQLLQLIKFWGEPGSAFSFGNDKVADTFYSLEFDMQPYGGIDEDHLPLEWYGDEDMIRTKAIDQNVLRKLIDGGLFPQFRWSGNRSLAIDYFFHHAVPTELLAGLHYVTELLVPGVVSDASSHKAYRDGKSQDSCYRLPGSWHQGTNQISTYFGRQGQGIEGVVKHLQQVDRCSLDDGALVVLLDSITGEGQDPASVSSHEVNKALHSGRLWAGHVLASKDAIAESVVSVDLLDSFAGLGDFLLPDELGFAAGSLYLLHRSVSHRHGFATSGAVAPLKVVTIFSSTGGEVPAHQQPAKIEQVWLTPQAAELYETWIEQGVPAGQSHPALHAEHGFVDYVCRRHGWDLPAVEAALTSAVVDKPALDPVKVTERRCKAKETVSYLKRKGIKPGVAAGPVLTTEAMEQALAAATTELIEKNPKNQRKYAEFAGKVLGYIVRKAWRVGPKVGVGVAEITEQFDLPNENEDYIHARRVMKYLRKHGMIAMVEDYVSKRLVRVFKLRADLQAQLPAPAPVQQQAEVLTGTGPAVQSWRPKSLSRMSLKEIQELDKDPAKKFMVNCMATRSAISSSISLFRHVSDSVEPAPATIMAIEPTQEPETNSTFEAPGDDA